MCEHVLMHVYVMRGAGWPLRTRPRYGTGRASGRQRAQGLEGCCRPTPNLNPSPPTGPAVLDPHPPHILYKYAGVGVCFAPWTLFIFGLVVSEVCFSIYSSYIAVILECYYGICLMRTC